MDAEQELFIALKLALEAKGYAVYDGALPPENTPYPFIYFGEFQQNETGYKNGMTGTVRPMIHVWHNDIRKRGTVSKMLFDIKMTLRSIMHTDSYSWLFRNFSSRILPDNTTKSPLLHGVLEVEGLFS